MPKIGPPVCMYASLQSCVHEDVPTSDIRDQLSSQTFFFQAHVPAGNGCPTNCSGMNEYEDRTDNSSDHVIR